MYQQSITHIHRTAVIIAIDCSLSMQNWTHLHHTRMRKMEAAALIANFAIDEIAVRATRGNEVRNYYDVAVIGYSGDGAEVIIGNEYNHLTDIKTLFERTPQPVCYNIEQYDCNGERVTTPITLHEWVKPKACGSTPMYEALTLSKSLISDWCDNPHNRISTPPLIINISDGGCSDADNDDIIDIAKDIQEIGTLDGATLLVNIYLATEGNNDNKSIVFPSLEEYSSDDQEELLLYNISSTLPQELEPILHKLTGYKRDGWCKCFARNASICEILAMADIGTEGCHGIKYR